jgi:3-phytase
MFRYFSNTPRTTAVLSLLVLTLICRGADQTFRVATFNIKELSTEKLIDIDENGIGQNPQLEAAAEIIRRVRPDVLVLNELDQDYEDVRRGLAGIDENARRFIEAYLKQGANPIDYPYVFVPPSNKGVLTGFDLDGDGVVSTEADVGSWSYAGDCFTWGTHPGAFSLGLLSKYPIDTENVRTFQYFLWKDLPGHHMPPDHYPEGLEELYRLSSKTHADVPVIFGRDSIHVLISVPTPPQFDGPEDRNGRRNFDEIKFWVHYIENDSSLYDDRGRHGGLETGQAFLIAGDLNASPFSKTIYDDQRSIEQLLNHPKIQDTGERLVSEGGAEGREVGPPMHYERSTASFGEDDYRTRIDYLLADLDLNVVDGGVFWPSSTSEPEDHRRALEASDHRLIWIDISF